LVQPSNSWSISLFIVPGFVPGSVSNIGPAYWGLVYAWQGSVGLVSNILGIFWLVVFGGACSTMVLVSEIGPVLYPPWYNPYGFHGMGYGFHRTGDGFHGMVHGFHME